MRSPTLLSRRLARLEQFVGKKLETHSADCICFPGNEQPFFGFEIEREIAAAVKCPCHGDRFRSDWSFVYVSKWRRATEWKRRDRLSQQYQKAWLASFPADLWPAEEEADDDGTVYLRLRDRTRLLAFVPGWIKDRRKEAS
jgi:hypothetical protein